MLQATALTFDVNGNLVSDSVAPAGGSSYSPAFLGQDTDVKNTNGNTLIIGTGASSVTLTYNNGISSTTPLATAGTTITATTGSVQLGSISYPISWTVGSSDGVTLKNIGDAINGLGIGLVANLSVAGSNTILNITSPTVSSAAGSFGMTITGIALTTTFVGASGQFRSISDVADALNAIPANTRPATPSVLVSNNNYQLRLIAAGGGPVTIGGNSGIAFTSTQPVGSIATAMTIPWNPNTIGAGNSVISFSYNPSNFYQAEQKYSGQISANGRSPGKLTGFSINGTGDIIGNFDNGDSRALARIALATFINPNGLTAGDDSTFSPNAASGPQTLVDSGSPGAGTITPSYLEDSNVDIVTELTKLVNLQRFYTANGKVLQAANNMTLEFVKSVIVT